MVRVFPFCIPPHVFALFSLLGCVLLPRQAEAQSRADHWTDLSPQRFFNDFGTPAITEQSYPGGSLYTWSGDWSTGITSDVGDTYASTIRYSRTAGVAMAYEGFTPFHQSFVPPGIYTHMQKGSFQVATDDALTGLRQLIFRVDVEGAGQFGLVSEYATLSSTSGDLLNVSATSITQGSALPEIVGGGHYIWEFVWDLSELGVVGTVEDFAVNWTLNQNNYTYGVELVQVIPEPGTFALLVVSGAGCFMLRRRRLPR